MERRTHSARLRDRWLDLVLRRRWMVLALGLVLTVASGWLTSKLKIDSDLRTMIDANHPVVGAIGDVETHFSAASSLEVVVKGSSQPVRRAFADALAERLQDHPLLTSVEARIDTQWFSDHALYYLSDAEMETLEERVMAWQHYELCSRAPDVCTEAPDPEAGGRLKDFLEDQKAKAKGRIGFDGYYERDGIDALVVFLEPRENAQDFRAAERVTEAMWSELRALQAEAGPWRDQPVEVNLLGAHVSKGSERRNVRRDMVRAGGVGLLGVLVVLYALFRSFRAIVTLLVPLTAGLVWSLAATQLVIGHLNMVTSLMSSVLLGLGIDTGIHLLTRVRRERERYDTDRAIREAFSSLLNPLLVASSTTIGAFTIMAMSPNPVFREFGTIAALGMALCLVAMLSVYPALLRVVGVKKPKRRESTVGPLTRILLARPRAIAVGCAALTFIAALGLRAVWVDGFEQNGRKLQSDEQRERMGPDAKLVEEIFGANPHAAVLRVETYAEIDRVYRRAVEARQERLDAGRETKVAAFVAAPAFLPSPDVDLQARQAAIETLTEDFTDETWARLEGKEVQGGDDDWEEFEEEADAAPPAEGSEPREPPKEAAEAPPEGVDAGAEPEPEPAGESEAALSPEEAARLKAMVAAQPFTVEDLPRSVLTKVRGRDGSWAILAYPNHDPAQLQDARAFLEETGDYTFGDARIYAGETTVFAVMYEELASQWLEVVLLALAVVSGLVLWQVRSLPRMLLTLTPLAVSLVWLLGFMGLVGAKFTLVNVPVLPAILGIGVDNGVYLVTAIHRRRGQQDGLARAVAQTGRAILAATATTASGFAALLIADSGAVRSIGMLAVLGVGMAALAAMLVLPTIWAMALQRSSAIALERRPTTAPHPVASSPVASSPTGPQPAAPVD